MKLSYVDTSRHTHKDMGQVESRPSWFTIALPLLATVTATATILLLNRENFANPSRRVDNSATEIKKLSQKLSRPDLECLDYTEHELYLARDIVSVVDLDVNFRDIGGLDETKEMLLENIILPIRYWIENFEKVQSVSSLIRCPTGVLLYGKPGTG
jgi:SpoVK/Ycf46/Vps4 family AAA+-type ATPase